MADQPLTTSVDSDRRDADPSQVIVTAGSTAHAVQAHHREIPELHVDGETPRSAAVNLERDLARQIDEVADACRREPFLRAIADVRVFIETSP